MSGSAEQRQHITRRIVEFIDCDDSRGYVKCSCGWRSSGMKVCWLATTEREHKLRGLDAGAVKP